MHLNLFLFLTIEETGITNNEGKLINQTVQIIFSPQSKREEMENIYVQIYFCSLFASFSLKSYRWTNHNSYRLMKNTNL